MSMVIKSNKIQSEQLNKKRFFNDAIRFFSGERGLDLSSYIYHTPPKNSKCTITGSELWHDLVTEELVSFQMGEEIKEWFNDFLLPISYWEQALRKTKYAEQRNFIKQQIDFCNTAENKVAEQFSRQEYEVLKDKALFLAAKFQAEYNRSQLQRTLSSDQSSEAVTNEK